MLVTHALSVVQGQLVQTISSCVRVTAINVWHHKLIYNATRSRRLNVHNEDLEDVLIAHI
jgi:hypothetical protein